MMNATATLPSVADLILVRLLVAGAKPKLADYRRQLTPLLREPISSAEWKEMTKELTAGGLIGGKPPALTEAGRARALEFLGVENLRPGTSWASVVSKHLVPMALGLSADDARTRELVGGADGLAAFVIKERYHLQSRSESSVAGVLNALVCKELGFPDAKDLGEVKRRVLSKLVDSTVPLTVEQLGRQIPRAAAGAARAGAREIRKAVFRRWLGGNTENGPEPPADIDLPTFANTIKAVARDCPGGWFGDRKVFINHVWRHFGRQDGVPALDLPEFKARLVEANRARLLDLSRADLPDQLPADDVRESETRQENAVFHFVQAERSRP
jgi:hypothetical protein